VQYKAPAVFCSNECKAFIPTALRTVVAAPTEGEHRRVTVGFIRFAGTDGLLARLGPDLVSDRLERLISAVQAATTDFDVTFLSTDLDADGGKIIVVGGAPTATGTDEERVLRALRRIADESHEIPLEIGVNHGAAFAGDVGAPFRRTYTVIGDAVNVAARVMGRAGAGEMLATGSVLDRSATRFELTDLPPFFAKGKAEPVEAWRVGAIEGRRSSSVSDGSIVGRDAELEVLEPYLEGGGDAGGVAIVGSSGIGKSRLVREVRARYPNIAWRFSDCDQYESTTPYYVFRRMLREVAGIGRQASSQKAARRVAVLLEERAPELLPWLPLVASVMSVPAEETVESAQLGAEFRQAKVHQTVAEFIDVMFDRAGMLVFEDVQWIDRESLDLLIALAGHARASNWGMIVVHRPFDEAFRSDDLVQLDLGPIDADSSRALAERALRDTPLREHQIVDIADRAGGNPLFLLELVEAARSGEVLPDSVESLVQARIDRLDRTQRRLLRYSSVMGIRFDPAVLTGAFRDDIPELTDGEVWDGLNEFLSRQSAGYLRFRQTLFHDVAYSGMSFRLRRSLHGRIGRVLESETADPEQLAEVLSLHFLLAGDYQEAWQYSGIAGRQASTKHANVAATRFYERALEAGRNVALRPEEIARVAESLGDVAEPAGLYEEAERGLRRAAKLRRDDAADSARIYRKLGLLRERAGKYPQALRWFTRGLRLVESAGTERELLQQVELQLAYAGVRFRQARYGESIAWAEKAIPSAERLDDKQAAAHGYYLVALARMRSGETQKQGHTEKALAIYETLADLVGQSNVLNKLGVDAYHAGDWTAARDYYHRSREARQKAGDSVRAAIITQNEALVLSDQGRLDGAEQLFRQALREFQAAEDQLATAVATSNLGRILTRRQDFTGGLELLKRALGELRAIGAGQFVVDAETRIAENLILSGDIGEGEKMIQEISKKVAVGDERHCQIHRLRAYAALQRGDRSDAVGFLESGVDEARGQGNQYELAVQLDALARITLEAGTRAEADAVLERLGIESVPLLPGELVND